MRDADGATCNSVQNCAYCFPSSSSQALTKIEHILQIATEGLRLELDPAGISPHMAKLIGICMNEDPGKRPSFEQVIPILEKMLKS